MTALHDRQRGCLLGLAVGDALGAAVEFQPPGAFEPVTGYRAGGPHGLAPGEWTDDTSMALALADSLAQVGWDLNDQARRYVDWHRRGKYSVNGRCFDIGIATRSALARFEHTADAHASGDASEQSSGNGSLMRLAPVPIRFLHLFPAKIDELARFAAESSLPTHASPQCLSACRYFALVLAGLMHGLDREEALSPTWPPLIELRTLEPLHPAVDAVAAGSFRRRRPPEIVGSGYVVNSLEAALWAFHDAVDFEQAVLRAVNLGHDADTTGAVCGQLAGAYWGEVGIPQPLKNGLAQRHLLEAALAGLLNVPREAGPQPPSPSVRLASPAAAPPMPRSFWVVEERLLAGAYPGASQPYEHRRRAQQLWQAGIRTCINLVEEHETNNIGEPFFRYDDLLREFADSTGEPFTHFRFPIRDLSIPSIDGMRTILDAIDLSLAAERPVYVHCFGGVGRTGSVVCCWLLRHGLATPETVVERLGQLRQSDELVKHRKAPENSEQLQFVLNWSD